MSKLKKNLFVYFLLVSMIVIAVRSKEILSCARESLVLCFTTVIPSLFPFMVLSSLFVSSYTNDSFKFASFMSNRLFGIRKAANAAFMCGLICGYPIGAKCTCELYKAKKISASEAESLIAYSNNSGPLFVIGAVGTGIFGSVKTGIFLYCVQLMSALCAAKILKSHTTYSLTPHHENSNTKISFTASVCTSVINIINVCGFIVFFSVINELIRPYITLLPSYIQAFAFCVLEITNSIVNITGLEYSYAIKLTFVSFALGWSGFSVHMQVKSLLTGTCLSMKKYYITRLLMGTFSALVTYTVLTRFDSISLLVCTNKIAVAVISFILSFLYIAKKREKAPSLSSV